MVFQILEGFVEAMEEELGGKRQGYTYCEFWTPKIPEIREALLKASRRKHKIYGSPARKRMLLAMVKRVDTIAKKFKGVTT